MAQFARPDADLVTGVWTTTPLWSDIDDGASPDGTVILSDSNPTSSEVFAVELSDIVDPQISTGHVLRALWAKNAGGGGGMNGVIELREGYVNEGSQGTLIATFTGANLNTQTLTTQTYTLTGGEADTITDYTDLQMRVWADGNRQWKIDYIELETTDVFFTETITDAVGITDTTIDALSLPPYPPYLPRKRLTTRM